MPADYQVPDDLEDRLVLSMLNEAVSCLHDGVVADADLLDAGVIFGTGFAPFRGGPIEYIKSVGAAPLKAKAGIVGYAIWLAFRAAPGLGRVVSLSFRSPAVSAADRA